jgi:DNA-binding response OmpR family regulator
MARILVVDPDPRPRVACAEDLRREGHEVLTAATGFEALRLVRDRAPQLVVTEVRLPGMDGIELMCRLVAKEQPPIVILHSASLAHRDSFLSWVADADLRKGADTSELRAKVQELLAKKNVSGPVEPPPGSAGFCEMAGGGWKHRPGGRHWS